jgi:mannosyltransferase
LLHFRSSAILWALAALCVCRLWLMPLRSSFWVDEMATVFVVTHGGHDPSLAVAPQVPASVYYALPRASTAVLGISEAAYRLPSVLAMGLALVLIARLAARLVHPEAGWFAVFASLALKGFDYEAANARPYALGAAVACLALYFLARWLDRARWRDAALFAAAAALLWRVHLLYWPFYAIFAIYTAVRLGRVGWARAAAVYGAIALLLIPVARQALALRGEAAGHVMTAMPGIRELLDSLKPGIVLVPAAAAAIVFRRRSGWKPQTASAVLIAAWWLTVPLALFAFSHLTGYSVFLDRYLSLALPGAAIAGTAATAFFLPARCWNTAAMLLGAGVLLFLGRWNAAWPPHHGSDWRGAAAAVAREARPETPVLCPSPFLEARPPAWRPAYPSDTFLYSNLVAYPVPGAPVTLPFEVEPAYGQRAIPAGRFVLYGGGRNAAAWRSWLLARPELRGWETRELGNFGDVLAVVFTPPGATMNFGR